MAVMPLAPETKMVGVGKLITLCNLLVSAHNYVLNFNFVLRFGAYCMKNIVHE